MPVIANFLHDETLEVKGRNRLKSLLRDVRYLASGGSNVLKNVKNTDHTFVNIRDHLWRKFNTIIILTVISIIISYVFWIDFVNIDYHNCSYWEIRLIQNALQNTIMTDH